MNKERPQKVKKNKANKELNHLVNFQYHQQDGDLRREGNRRRPNSGRSQQQAPKPQRKENEWTSCDFSKKQQILTKFWFGLVPNSEGKPSISSVVGSTNVDWSEISTVYSSQNDEKCPICLEELQVPKISKCGHKFCTLCLYRMFHHEARQQLQNNQGEIKNLWVSCPLCFSYMKKDEAKFVEFFGKAADDIKPGDSCTFVLCCRYASSSVFVKASDVLTMKQNVSLPTKSGTFLERNDGLHCRFFLDDPKSLNEMCSKKLDLVKKQYSEAHAWQDQEGMKLLEEAANDIRSFYSRAVESAAKFNPIEENDVAEERKYFYRLECEDEGLNLFLHPFNLNCLRRDFGDDFSKYPLKLENVKIQNIFKYESINEEFLRRFSFINHLLPASTVSFVEVNLRNYISDDTNEAFAEEFKQRKMERDREKRFQKRLSQKLAQRGRKNSSIRDEFHSQLVQLQNFDREGVMNYVRHNEEIDEDLKEFLKSSYEEDHSSQSDAASPQGAWGSHAPHSLSKMVQNEGFFPALPQTSSTVPSKLDKPGWVVLSRKPATDKVDVEKNEQEKANVLSFDKLNISQTKKKGKKVTLLSTSTHRSYK